MSMRDLRIRGSRVVEDEEEDHQRDGWNVLKKTSESWANVSKFWKTTGRQGM